MPQQKIAKKLPRRCTNDRLKDRRAKSWARGETRKMKRREEQHKREIENRKRMSQAIPTIHEAKKLNACAKCNGRFALTHGAVHGRMSEKDKEELYG